MPTQLGDLPRLKRAAQSSPLIWSSRKQILLWRLWNFPSSMQKTQNYRRKLLMCGTARQWVQNMQVVKGSGVNIPVKRLTAPSILWVVVPAPRVLRNYRMKI